MSRTAILRQMQEDLQQCRNCGLCEGRTQAVLGAGVPNSRIVIVGEGPGRNEDEQGKPFVGRSGQLLDQMLEQVGLSRNRNVFITNIVKCRPPENRDPMPEECLAVPGWTRSWSSLTRRSFCVWDGSPPSSCLTPISG